MTKYVNIYFPKIEYVTSEMALKLYAQGCRVQCPGCNKKNFWDFKAGRTNLDKIEESLTKYSIAIKKIVVTGGEPLQQDLVELVKVFKFLRSFDKEVWLLTSKDMAEVYPEIRECTDFIKTGIHDPISGPGLIEYGYKLSSKNQKVWKNGVDY